MAPTSQADPIDTRNWPSFVHLKVHSAYSLLEGALPIAKLVCLAVDQQLPALAITDTNNLFGVLEFSEKMAAAGVQPIAGVSLALEVKQTDTDPLAAVQQPVRLHPHRDGLIALYAMDDAGYANLLKLVSKAHLESGDDGEPYVSLADLETNGTGLIILTGGPAGPIDRLLQDGRRQEAEQVLLALKEIFGDRLYVELQRHGNRDQTRREPILLDFSYRNDIGIVATNECCFANPDEYEAHDAMLCIADGRYVVEDDRRRLTPQHYFKSPSEMSALFADLPEALAATIEIAQRCTFRPLGKAPILPRFVSAGAGATPQEQFAAEAKELRVQAEAGLDWRLNEHGVAEGYTEQDYRERLQFELGIIESMKFPGYFLIVADFIQWSKAQGIPVGPGRGSGAGSLVAWALTITDLDPLRFGLLFERFLNPERISMPDFDIDFCQDRRDEVIKYVQQKYGADRVAQIITHGKLQARAVLRDVGRVLQMPFGQVDRLCKLVPNNPAKPVTLAQAIDEEPRLQEERDNDQMVERLLEFGQTLEGLYRHASTHAAGMVIGDRPLVELVPLYRDPKSSFPITQFNWKMVEAAGLVKFDFLGLKTLTVLEKAVALIKQGRGIDIDLTQVGIDDRKAYELMAAADTVGVFQLESTGMRESLKKLRPDRFEDIIAMVALYRPGPMDNIPIYINRKHGEEEVDYLHPVLEPILKETYGVIIYQEQVMQIAQVMAGYSLGEADLLRRAMGKKDKNEMAAQQQRFVDGAVANGVDKHDAVFIFELVDKFAGYGFNKSHAAAYALVSYHTAYLKANYREEFLAASMSLDMANTDKLALFASEARKSGIEVLPPSVNASGVDFGATPGSDAKPGAVRYSLAALKNVGEAAIDSIVQSRDTEGKFKSLSDFAARMDTKTINKRALETLAAAGAFDDLEPNRALVHANVEQMMALANRLASNAASGIDDLFASATDGPGPEIDMRPARPWTPMERLEREFSATGFYLSGHPLDQYDSALRTLGASRWAEFEAAAQNGTLAGRLAAVVVSARERKSQKGNKFAFGMFSDSSGQFEAVIFSDILETARDLLEPGTPVLITVSAERDGDSVRLRIEALQSLNEAVAGLKGGLRLVVDEAELSGQRSEMFWADLKQHLKPGRGEIRLSVSLSKPGREVEFALNGTFDVSPARRGELTTLPGIVMVADL